VYEAWQREKKGMRKKTNRRRIAFQMTKRATIKDAPPPFASSE